MTRGERIRLFRKVVLGGYRQADLAKAVGVARNTVISWEKDAPSAPRAMLALIAHLAQPSEVALDWLDGSTPGDVPPELRRKSSTRPTAPPIRPGVGHGGLPQAPALERLRHDVRGFELRGQMIDPRWMWERLAEYARELAEETPPTNDNKAS